MLDGTRAWGDFDYTDVIGGAALGFTMAGLYNCGVATKAVLEVAQWGFLTMQVVGGLNELSQGHGFTGAFDLVTAAVPFLFKRSCFTAETPVLTLDGSKRIADLVEGDLVLSRDERDPDAPVVARVVEEVFVRSSPILLLRVRGREIRTTAEHPFWVHGKGWTPAGSLAEGDLLLSHDGRLSLVEAVEDSRQVATVYNCRVAEHHTYFVGCADWGFSLWAHNAEYELVSRGKGWYRLRNLTTLQEVPGGRSGRPLAVRGRANARERAIDLQARDMLIEEQARTDALAAEMARDGAPPQVVGRWRAGARQRTLDRIAQMRRGDELHQLPGRWFPGDGNWHQ